MGNGFSVILDIMTKKRGLCLRITKIAQGQGRLILIPEGERRTGWKKFSRTLELVLGRWTVDQRAGDPMASEARRSDTKLS